MIIVHRTTDSGTRGIVFNKSSLAKKQKLMLNLLLLQEADEEHAVIKHVILCDAEKTKHTICSWPEKLKVCLVFLLRNIYGVTKKKFREFFRVSCDQFHYILNIIEDVKTSPSIKISEPITAAGKLAITLSYV